MPQYIASGNLIFSAQSHDAEALQGEIEGHLARELGYEVATLADLRTEIRGHTESDEEASSILRCLERFGGDPSIGHFEITPKPSRRTYRDASAVTWSVTATG